MKNISKNDLHPDRSELDIIRILQYQAHGTLAIVAEIQGPRIFPNLAHPSSSVPSTALVGSFHASGFEVPRGFEISPENGQNGKRESG